MFAFFLLLALAFFFPSSALAACCNGPSYCNPLSYNSCKVSTSCSWTCAIPTPTSAPSYTCNGSCIYYSEPCYRSGSGTCPSNYSCCSQQDPPATTVPTPTPNLNLCTERAGKCVPSNYICSSSTITGTCSTGLKCVPETASCAAPTPTQVPAPTATPVPQVCEPGTSICTDAPVNSPSGPTLRTCNSSGSGWDTSTCTSTQECNRYHTQCLDTIVTYSSPPPLCANYDTKCESGKKYTCVDGEWMPNTNSTSCIGVTPTPAPTVNSRDCNLVNGKVVCSQVDSDWKNITYPYSCYDNNQQLITNTYTLGQRGCGQSTICSVLCECLGATNATYCNVPNCVKSIPEFATISCNGTGLDLNVPIIRRFPQCYNVINKITPDIVASPPQISRNELSKYTSYGDVLVQGIFVNKYTGEVTRHNSRICGTKNGQFVFCDSYFNSDNSQFTSQFAQYVPNQTDTTLLENLYTITYLDASLIVK